MQPWARTLSTTRHLHALLLLALTPAAFAEAVPSEKLPSAEELERSRIVCKYERPIGSLIRVKKCRTKGEMTQTTADSQRKLRDIQDNSVRSPMPMGMKPPPNG